MFGKKKVAMLVAEFVGTAVLTLTVLSVRSSGIGYALFVALAAGIVVGSMMLVIGPASGAQLNPALTLGLWSARKVKTIPTILYMAAQLLGGAAAYWLYVYLVKTHLPNSAGHYAARVMIAEAMGAFVFAFSWMSAAAQKLTGVKLAAVVGGAFAVGVIVASIGSNAFINPAIALGAHAWGWSTYVAGPVLGAIVGVNLYDLLFSDGILKLKAASAASSSRSTSTTTVKPAKKKSARKNRK